MNNQEIPQAVAHVEIVKAIELTDAQKLFAASAPTPRRDAWRTMISGLRLKGADAFLKLDELTGQLERELSAKTAEVEKIGETYLEMCACLIKIGETIGQDPLDGLAKLPQHVDARMAESRRLREALENAAELLENEGDLATAEALKKQLADVSAPATVKEQVRDGEWVEKVAEEIAQQIIDKYAPDGTTELSASNLYYGLQAIAEEAIEKSLSESPSDQGWRKDKL